MSQIKFCNFIFIFIFGILSSQTLKLKIEDSESNDPISHARIILSNIILYSNDDGFVLLPENSKNFEISASGYQTEKFANYTEVLKLKPLYKDIDEVTIVNVDIKKIFEDVFDNYTDRYYTKPTVYDITYNQKNSSNGKVNFLFIFDGKLWTLSNTYLFKDAINKKFDGFVQMQIDKVRYYKSQEFTNELEAGALDKSKDFIGDIFFNFQLSRLTRMFKMKDIKSSGRLINESNDEQIISYSITIPKNMKISGVFTYNKTDKVITHLEFNYDQSLQEAVKKKKQNGDSYLYKLGNGKITYDFYKRNNNYMPTAVISEGEGYTSIIDTTEISNSFKREVIFRKFNPADMNGLENKIDLSKKIWENIPNQNQKDSNILLSSEEQQFTEEKTNEKN